jgi:hypothetical protein
MAKAAMTKDKARPWIWLQSMTDKDRWSLDHIPEGDAHAPRITRSSKNSDGSYSFFVYRDCKYIDTGTTLDEAQKLAKAGKMRAERIDAVARIRKFIDAGERSGDQFKKLSKHEQQVIAEVYPWALPRRTEMADKGIKVNVQRDDLKSKSEKAADRAALPLDEKITRAKDGNPKREGTDAWKRWHLLFECAGKTVGEFVKMGGNPTTLKNAVKLGYVKVKGMS